MFEPSYNDFKFRFKTIITLAPVLYHIFIHSSVDGHLGCFRTLAVANSAAINIGVEKEMATHSSILAWRILWTEELGRL